MYMHTMADIHREQSNHMSCEVLTILSDTVGCTMYMHMEVQYMYIYVLMEVMVVQYMYM